MINRCVFVGNFYTDKMIKNYSKYTSLSIGNDNYEKSFLLILRNTFNKVNAFSAPSVPTFSKNFPFFKMHGENGVINQVETSFIPFVNLKLINSKRSSIKRRLFRFLKQEQVDYVFLSTYHFAWLIRPIKLRFPNVKVSFLLPDLSSINVSSNSLYFSLYLKKVNKELNKNISLVDVLLPITEHQIEKLPDFKGKQFVYETFFDASVFNSINVQKEKQILYAGTLNESYGIMGLINEFIKLKDFDYSLIVCGKGDCDSEIDTISKKYPNIKYLKMLPKKEVLLLEKQSMLIVCPDEQDRKYSFHSRYLEYLSSGTPILTYKPSGAKQEYLKYFNYVENYSGLGNAVKMILEKDYQIALKKAEEARDFMLTNKNVDAFSKELLKVL